MVSKLWLRYWISLSVFAFLHYLYLAFDSGLVDGDKNIIWYGFLAVMGMIMGLTMMACRFKPFSSYIAVLCFAGVLVNMSMGAWHVYSDITPVWVDAFIGELYGWISYGITGTQVLFFIVAGEQIGRYNGNTNNSIFSLFVDENTQSYGRNLGR